MISHPEFQRGEATVNFIPNHPELFENLTKWKDTGTRSLNYLSDVIVNCVAASFKLPTESVATPALTSTVMTPSELIESATGMPPNPEPFLNYVEEKYSKLYNL